MKLTIEQIRELIREELNNFTNENLDAGDMAQEYYPAPSPAFEEWESAVLRYNAEDVQFDPELRYEAAQAAEEAAYAALDAGAEGEMADEISDFLNQLYASGDLN